MIDNPNHCGINRRPIAKAIENGQWDMEFLAHLSRYAQTTHLIRGQAKALGRGVDILDVGCGDLWPLRAIVKHPFWREDQLLHSYTALDIEEPDTSFITKRTPGFKFIQQDLTLDPRIPLLDASVDFIVSTEVFEHMLPKFSVPWLRDIHRVARPGALFYFSTPNADNSRTQPEDTHPFEWPYADLLTALEIEWEILSIIGTFIRMTTFIRVNKIHGRVPQGVMDVLIRNFDTTWQRLILSAFYPEFSENVALILRKREGI